MESLGQKEPQYKSYFYFEDSAGNKDTIYVGHDDDIPLDNQGVNVDTDYGEILDTTVFSPEFEVRAGPLSDGVHGIDSRKYRLFKNLMLRANYEGGNCLWPETVYFFIHSKNFPIKITWDIQFDSPCMSGSFFTPDKLYDLIDPSIWIEFDWIRFSCLPKSNEFILELPDGYKDENGWGEFPIFIERPVEGSMNAVDTIWGIELIHGPEDGYSPCILIVSAEDQKSNSSVSFFPTPTIDIVTFNFSNTGQYKLYIYDFSGKIQSISDITGPDIFKLDVSSYPDGIYIYDIIQDKKCIQAGRVIKI